MTELLRESLECLDCWSVSMAVTGVDGAVCGWWIEERRRKECEAGREAEHRGEESRQCGWERARRDLGLFEMARLEGLLAY